MVCCIYFKTVESARGRIPEATDDKDAVDKLWDKIFIATRIYEEDPVASWKAHTENLKRKNRFLNS